MGLRNSDTKPDHGSIWQRLRMKSQASSTSQLLPESWQCITHLKLLRLFAGLQRDVIDILLQPSVLDSMFPGLPQNERRQAESSVRDQVWQMYLEHASERFELWWKSLAGKDKTGDTRQIDTSACLQPGKLEAMLHGVQPMVWTEKNLPPLEVIMILHSFMLNPRCFLEDCVRYTMLPLWKAGMPWRLLDAAINTATNEYHTSPAAQNSWIRTTGCAWDIREDRMERTVSCPICSTAIKRRSPAINLDIRNINSLRDPNNSFDVQCEKCNTHFSTNDLKICKLRRVVQSLRQRNKPMPGTILTTNGLAQSALKDGIDPELFGLNRLLQGDTGEQLLEMTTPDLMHTVSWPQLKDLQAVIERALVDNSDQNLKVATHRAIRQVTDTDSMFALGLPAAVIRQGAFIEKMEEIDWLHSPALEYTMDDLLARYSVFFRIMKNNKDNVAVPTYAVDLAWHTHQLSPASYYAFSVSNAGNVFIDHDDRIEEGVRTDAFDWTSKQYKQLSNGMDYSNCLCWYCATAYDSTGGNPDALTVGEHGHVKLESGSELGKSTLSRIAMNQYRKLEEDFNIACRLAEKHGLPAPDHKEYLKSYKWLYPQAVPVIDG